MREGRGVRFWLTRIVRRTYRLKRSTEWTLLDAVFAVAANAATMTDVSATSRMRPREARFLSTGSIEPRPLSGERETMKSSLALS